MYCYVFSKKLKSFVKPKPARVLVLMERGVKRSALGPVAFDDAIQSITVGGPDIQAEDWSNSEVKNKSKDVEGSKDVPNSTPLPAQPSSDVKHVKADSALSQSGLAADAELCSVRLELLLVRTQLTGLRYYSKVKRWLHGIPNDYKVYSLLLLSCFFFSLCSLFTEFVSHVPIIELLWWRFFFTLSCTVVINLINDYPSPLNVPNSRMVLLTAVLGTITASCTVFALRNLPIGEATLLLTTAPIFTVLLSSCILKERLIWTDFIALSLATVGVFFVAQPSFIFQPGGATAEDPSTKNKMFYIAIFVALGRGFFKAAKYVAVSCTGLDVPATVIVMSLSLLGFILSTILLIANTLGNVMRGLSMDKSWKNLDFENLWYLFIVGLTYCLQQVCVCAAMQFGKPAKTSLLKYFDVVLPFIFQLAIFRTYPDAWTLIGCVLIVLSTLSVICVGIYGRKSIPHQLFDNEGEEKDGTNQGSSMVMRSPTKTLPRLELDQSAV